MKIAIDARTMGSRPSGVGMYLNDFLKVLMQRQEFEFVLLTDVAESEYIKNFMNAGMEVRAQGTPVYKSAGVYGYFSFIQKQLDEIQPDIFWEVNTVIPVSLHGSFKTMITIHDMFPIEYVEYFGMIYSLYFRHSLKKTLRHTDLILYNSNQTKKTTETAFPEAAKIPNCTGYIIANPLRNKRESRDQGYLLYVGNMEKRKGVDLLVKAYQRYRELGGVRPLILAGKMQEDDIARLMADAMKKVKGMEYRNYVPHEKKHELYANCSCFVFPSKAEGFGMPLIEVMKFKKPILVGNLDIYEEIVGDCVNRFDLHGSEQQQIEHLAEGMLHFEEHVDEEAYEEVIGRYTPERLGGIVSSFILEQMQSGTEDGSKS